MLLILAAGSSIAQFKFRVDLDMLVRDSVARAQRIAKKLARITRSQSSVKSAFRVAQISLSFNLPNGRQHKIFIERFCKQKGYWTLIGWSTATNIELSLSNGQKNTPLKVRRHKRGDVSEQLDLHPESKPGISAICEADKIDGILSLNIKGPTHDVVKVDLSPNGADLSDKEKGLFPELLKQELDILRTLKPGSIEWWNAANRIPYTDKPACTAGYIEDIIKSPAGNGVVFGWAVVSPHSANWIETSEGEIKLLSDGFRLNRSDVFRANEHSPWRSAQSGFIVEIPTVSAGMEVKLVSASSHGKTVLSQCIQRNSFKSPPKLAAEALFAIETRTNDFYKRAEKVDWPILKPLIDRQVYDNKNITPEVLDFGQPAQSPAISVIVPLYNRFDFMENQILEFSRDSSFTETAELIYVVDDPRITSQVVAEAYKLFELYKLPFRIIDGRENRGFSAANNLGADYASGDHLLFLNSDVIPTKAGWLDKMLSAFDTQNNVGAVGARLLFPDKSIQHSGMESVYLEDLNIWSNQHPGIGMSPRLDDDKVREVPAVTGACLLIPASLFSTINGWDTGYLLGDFEDSDLCFSLREAGYSILYQPQAELTHLERQSFSGIGNSDFRDRVTISNAIRHQKRWASMLEELNYNSSAATVETV